MDKRRRRKDKLKCNEKLDADYGKLSRYSSFTD